MTQNFSKTSILRFEKVTKDRPVFNSLPSLGFCLFCLHFMDNLLIMHNFNLVTSSIWGSLGGAFIVKFSAWLDLYCGCNSFADGFVELYFFVG